MSAVDLAAVGRGAGVALLVAVPAVIVQNIAEGGPLRSAAFLASLAAFGLGGHTAARTRPARALTHGGLAGLAAGLAVLAAGALRRSAAGEAVSWLSQPVLALLAFSSGLIGGYIAFRRAADDGSEPMT